MLSSCKQPEVVALVMEVPQDKLGLAGTEKLDIVNFKCDPILISSLRGETGIFPAYHMNKASWITARAGRQRAGRNDRAAAGREL
ncbi:MAG: MmcQ/YjbR family DNA-binding protein [Acutalibacteraceae bacterium]